ncbi:hypothetical protein Ssi02_47370 [Sinosporangium siamense]|uniref:Uncharacterized protein n=1 Tax=Sinosporangium siamense TaxID=1367973 RepID=A0A919RII7_9ACTN|nr:hypothetical protein Ssi02_47370 [Sinosporangium siamense]
MPAGSVNTTVTSPCSSGSLCVIIKGALRMGGGPEAAPVSSYRDRGMKGGPPRRGRVWSWRSLRRPGIGLLPGRKERRDASLMAAYPLGRPSHGSGPPTAGLMGAEVALNV